MNAVIPEEGKTRSKPPTAIWRWAARVFTIALLAWVVYKQDWHALGEILTTWQGIAVILASVVSMLAGQVCAASRWLILLRIQNPAFSFWQALRLTLIGAFASLFLPTTAGGDLVRILSLNDRDRVASVSVVAMDRIISVISMVLLVPLSMLILLPALPGVGMLGVFVLLAVFQPSGLRRWLSRLQKFWNELKGSLLSWKKHPGRLSAAFVLALGSNAFSWLSVWMIAWQLQIDASYWQVVAAGVWIYAAGLLPVAINGLGVQEAGYVYLYSWISAAAAGTAATLGLLTRLVYILAILPGGIWLLFSPAIRSLLRKPGA